MSKFDRNRIKDGWEKLGTNKQTHRHYENNGHLGVNQQQYLLHMSLQYSECRPTNGWDRFGSLGHPSKFQRVSRLGLVTAQTSLNGGQPNIAQRFAISWAGTLYIHFRGLLPLTEFYQVQNSLCVQVLRSPMLARVGLKTADHRKPPQTTAGRTADHHRTAQDASQNTAGRGK